MRPRSTFLGIAGLAALMAMSATPLARSSFGALQQLWTRNGADLHNTNRRHVGIGTSRPKAKLDVNGDIALSGQPVFTASGQFVGNGALKVNPMQVATQRWYEVQAPPHSFPLGRVPIAMAFDGKDLWVADTLEPSLYRVSAIDGDLVDTYSLSASGDLVVFDGEFVWVYMVSREQVSKVRATDGVVIDSYPVASRVDDILFDGNSLWVANTNDETVTQMDPSDGTEVAEYSTTRPHTLAFDGVSLWIGGLDQSVTQMHPGDGTVLNTFAMPSNPADLVFDGEHLWVGMNNNQVWKVRRSDGVALEVLQVADMETMAFDGQFLWVGGTDGVDKIRVSDGSVVGSSTAGVRSLTFDGTSMWSCGPLTPEIQRF